MTLLFISHSSEDDASASRVTAWLAERGFQSLFLDFDPVRGIPAGRSWEQELYARLRQADAVVFLGSPASLESRWCFAELVLARAWGVRVFPLLVDGDARHPLLRDLQWIDLVRDTDALDRLLAALRLQGFDPATTFGWDPTRPPYPGLRAFQPEEAAVFFGREEEVRELLERLQPSLRRRSASLALVGPSGSGKSSLVHAGLLPRLRRLPSEWAVLPPVFPGDRPVRALARSLAQGLAQELVPHDWRQLEERLRREPGVLLELAGDLAEAQGTSGRLVLLFIDQAEELVTLASAEACEDLLSVLGTAVNAPGPLRLLFTLRSEFLSGLLRRPGMGDLLRDSMALGPLDHARLPAVIAGPARRAGLVLEDGLLERVVADAQGGDALPLLAYTLRELHERAGADGTLSLASYEARGGVLGALRGQADRVLEELDRRGLGLLVLPTLLKLVTLGDGDEPARRRLARNRLAPPENMVIDAFIDAHLLVTDQVDDEPVVAVAHEALFRGWPPLAEAVEAARDDLRQRAQLERAALDWERAGRQPAYALPGARLQVAERWAEAHPDEMEQLPLLHQYIRASAESDASARRRTAESLARRVLDGFDDDPDLAVPLAVAAIEQYGPSPQLVEALRAALRRSRLRAVLGGHGAPVTSVAWALDGRRAATGAADGGVRLWDTMNGHQILAVEGDGKPVTGLAFSPDGSELAVAAKDRLGRVLELLGQTERLALRGNSGFTPSMFAYMPGGGRIVGGCGMDVVIWDAGDGSVLEVLRGIGAALALSPDGDRIFTMNTSATAPAVRGLGGRPELLDLRETGRYHVQTARENTYASSVAWSPDGSRLAAVIESAGWVWDAGDGRLVTTLQPGQPVAAPARSSGSAAITSVAFSADASRAVSVFRDGVPRVWDAGDGRELFLLRGHSAAVACTAFSPRGTRVLTGSDDGTARVWEVGDGHDVLPGVDGLLYELGGHAPLTGAAFSPDGTRIVSSSTDGAVRLWEAGASGGREITALHGHGGVVTAVSFSPDGSLILTASEDGTLRFWPADGRGESRIVEGPRGVGRAAGAPAHFMSAVFSADGSRVVAGLADASARVWDVAGGEQRLGLHGHSGRVTSVAYSPDGRRIATGSWDRMFSSGMMGEATALVWDATTGQAVHRLAHRARVLSVAFSPDGARLATGTEDAAARLWDAETGAELRALRDHRAAVRSVAFAPDGTRLLTASDDATARVWDVIDGRERFVFAGHRGPLRSAGFAPDGGRIVTASQDGTVRVWQETGVEELLRTAHRRLPRRLTPEERQRFGLPEGRVDGVPLTRVADLPEVEDDDGGGPADRDSLVAERALAIARSSQAGTAEENWLRAERELQAEGRLP